VTQPADALDVSQEEALPGSPTTPTILDGKQQVAGSVTYWLLGLLTVIAITYPIAAAVLAQDRWLRVEAVLNFTFAGIVGLVGTAVAFWFSERRK
jgi:hypothetical protein